MAIPLSCYMAGHTSYLNEKVWQLSEKERWDDKSRSTPLLSHYSIIGMCFSTAAILRATHGGGRLSVLLRRCPPPHHHRSTFHAALRQEVLTPSLVQWSAHILVVVSFIFSFPPSSFLPFHLPFSILQISYLHNQQSDSALVKRRQMAGMWMWSPKRSLFILLLHSFTVFVCFLFFIRNKWHFILNIL